MTGPVIAETEAAIDALTAELEGLRSALDTTENADAHVSSDDIQALEIQIELLTSNVQFESDLLDEARMRAVSE